MLSNTSACFPHALNFEHLIVNHFIITYHSSVTGKLVFHDEFKQHWGQNNEGFDFLSGPFSVCCWWNTVLLVYCILHVISLCHGIFFILPSTWGTSSNGIKALQLPFHLATARSIHNHTPPELCLCASMRLLKHSWTVWPGKWWIPHPKHPPPPFGCVCSNVTALSLRWLYFRVCVSMLFWLRHFQAMVSFFSTSTLCRNRLKERGGAANHQLIFIFILSL